LCLRNGIRTSLGTHGIHAEAHLESGQAEAVSVRKACISPDVQKLMETNAPNAIGDGYNLLST
jgi:hypothetical protein